MEIITMLGEKIFIPIIVNAVKEILKKDPITSAIDQAMDELRQEKQNDWFELREIDRNRKEIFENINLTDKTTFQDLLIKHEVKLETATKLYERFSKKFQDNIKKAVMKEPTVFFAYAMGEFEKNKIANDELKKHLKKFVDEVKHLKELEKNPISIPEIQDVLRKKETFKGEFFRKEPLWVDYKQGFIVERKEVDEIIGKLDNNIQLVFGAPSSGKSIILKNIGYKLAKKNKKVYFVELKKHTQDEIKLFFENSKMNDENQIFIVDDAHLYLSHCEKLAKEFKNRVKGNLIIGSRETGEISEEHPKECTEYEVLSELSKMAVHVKAEDVTEGMIRTFLEKQYKFDEENINAVSSTLNKYKNDLWLLSWALKAYNKDKKTVVTEEIYAKITDSIKRIKIGKNKKTINAEEVFLPLSVFYIFEIQIERYFLIEQLGIEAEIINQLNGLQEIVEIPETGMLSLHHSSIAELYFGAYLYKSFLGKRIKKKILNGKIENKDNLNFCLFYQYFTTTDSRNSIDVIIHLGRDLEDIKGGKTLLKNLIEEEKIQQSYCRWNKQRREYKKSGYMFINYRQGERRNCIVRG